MQDSFISGVSSETFAALQEDNNRLRKENDRLHILLKRHGIDDGPNLEPEAVVKVSQVSPIPIQAAVSKQSPFQEKASLFLSLFHGRDDVYARQWQSKDGKVGYSPACQNEWKRGICGKPKQKCADCVNAVYLPYDTEVIRAHLSGKYVVGIYPLMINDTCAFLAIDFDEERWRDDVCAVSDSCKAIGIPCATEISRSGNGAHLWFFFCSPMEASRARTFGTLMLTIAMEQHARLAFSSYDRMFPNQDTMPKGGFGNLIALPFQPAAYKHGGAVFVDEQFHPYEDQWTFMSSIQRITSEQVDEYLSQRSIPPMGELRIEAEDAESKPWRRKEIQLTSADFPSIVQATIADRLYIPIEGVSNKAQNKMKRLAAFRNPQFYQAQAMRMLIWNKPRVICCAEYIDQYLCMPRGCKEQFSDLVKLSGASIHWSDERNAGRSIDVSFTGTLHDEQGSALNALLAHDDGILSATTAFGKTVVGAALIAQRKVNTLILVHRKQLLSQWKRRRRWRTVSRKR